MQYLAKFSATGQPLTLNTEGGVITTKAVTTQFAGQLIYVQFVTTFTAGASATSVQAIIRRGSDTTGTAVMSVPAITVVGGQIYQWTFATTDVQAGEITAQQYTLTMIQTAATGNGSAAINSALVVVA